MQHPLAEQRKVCLPIALSFDQLQLGHMPFHHAVIDPPGETCSHRLFVFLDSCESWTGVLEGCCSLPEPANYRGDPLSDDGASGRTAAADHRPDPRAPMELAKHEQALSLFTTQF